MTYFTVIAVLADDVIVRLDTSRSYRVASCQAGQHNVNNSQRCGEILERKMKKKTFDGQKVATCDRDGMNEMPR